MVYSFIGLGRMANDVISPPLITRGLPTRFIGQRVLYYPRLTSTMDIARWEARQKAPEGTVVIADEQTAGRGRIQRVWLSPKGSVSLSVLLYPSLTSLPYLVMLTSLAVVHAVEALTGLKSQIKWPNDVLINRKKVCGILVESDVRGDKVNYAIIGIGINVNNTMADSPEIAAIATSLRDEGGKEISRADLIRQLLIDIEKLYLTLPDGSHIYDEWREKLVTLGKRVRVQSGQTVLEGIAESVDADGRLLLRHPDGTVTRVIAGDVSLRDY